MADVLSQSEIDALLAAVSEPRGRGEAAAADVRYYDFLRPERASPTVMRALTDLHEAGARNVAAALGGALRTNVDCRLQAFEQTTWGEFAMGMPNPTCFAAAVAKPYGARFALEIGPAIMHPMIERLLGGPAGASGGAAGEPPARPLTAIERRVAGTLVEVVLGALAGVWGRVEAVELVPVQIETNPQVVPVAPPAEMAAAATFELGVGQHGDTPSAGPEGLGGAPAGRAGLMHVCMPFSTFGPLFDELARMGEQATAMGAERPEAGDATRAAVRALIQVPARVEAFAAWTRMTLREIAGLSVGDAIAAGRSSGGEVVLTVAGIPKFAASEGDFRGRKAVRVLRKLRGAPAGFGVAEGGRP